MRKSMNGNGVPPIEKPRNNIRFIRRMRDLSQGRLAEMIGSRQAYVNIMEYKNASLLKRETLIAIAKALKCSVADLLAPYGTVPTGKAPVTRKPKVAKV